MKALRTVRRLDLPDWLIAAGFIRNLIWDSQFFSKVALNDIDVVYFCLTDTSKERDLALEKRLRKLEPDLPWSVKNQARMHLKHGDNPYKSTLDAMRYWPEKQTSIGARLDHSDNVIVQNCFDLSHQFNRHINHNPARSIKVFDDRVSAKNWLKKWPELRIKT